MMETLDEKVAFGQKLVKKVKPPKEFQFALGEEAKVLMEIAREEKRLRIHFEHEHDEEEKKKIADAIEVERRRELSATGHRKQLEATTDELKDLKFNLGKARTAKGLVAQLKMEDEEIDRRCEIVKRDAENFKTFFRVRQEQKDIIEKEKLLRNHQHRFDLQAQMKVNEMKRLDDRMEYVRTGQEIRNQAKEADRKYQKELEAAAIAHRKANQEACETMQRRLEAKKMEKVDESHFLKELLQIQKRDDEIAQGIVDARKERVRRQLEVGEQLGQELYAINRAKEQARENLVDRLVNDMKHRTDMMLEQQEKQLKERQKRMDRDMRIHMAEKQIKHEIYQSQTNEDMIERLTKRSHHESEMDLLSKRIERERKDIEKFLKMNEVLKEERKAKHKLLITTGLTPQALEKKAQEDIKAVRDEILQEQPISLLRYLSPSVLAKCLPESLTERVKEQAAKDPIPVFNVKRHLRHFQRIKDEGGGIVKCCEACPPPRLLSNIF